MKEGKFVISLDFELHWGFFDVRTLTDSKDQLARVEQVIEKLLTLCKSYDVGITFATVGFLFARNKKELEPFLPSSKPDYHNLELNPYKLLEEMHDKDQPFYFAKSLVEKIKADGLHEIGTHTFSHYYCYEKGQNKANFQADIHAAVEVAAQMDIETKSIVFPRNQVNKDYIDVCENLGIATYRGNGWFNFNNDAKQRKLKGYAMKVSRVLDTYLNISGSNSYKLKDYNSSSGGVINIPASRFLRPYSPRFKALESLKINRIKSAMTKAAKNKQVYHLWWHPHNFANHIDENFKNLETIFSHYKQLQSQYNFKSITMSALAQEFKEHTAV